jgi:hypothetical protein
MDREIREPALNVSRSQMELLLRPDSKAIERIIMAVATTVVVSGCAGLADIAMATNASANPDPGGPSGRWCPGQDLPLTGYPPHPKVWNMRVCHDWYSILNSDNDTWAIIEGKLPFS